MADDVVVAVDGSPESAHALRWAAWFTGATARPLHLVHAWQRRGPIVASLRVTSDDADVVEAAVCDRLRAIAVEAIGDADRVASCTALRGDIADAIAKHAARADAGLIVTGTHGAGGARRALLGSVARRLTEFPTRAVAVVPHDDDLPEGPAWSMVVGTDGSTGAARAVRWAGRVAREGAGELVVVHTLEPPVPDPTGAEVAFLRDEAATRLDQEWCAPLRELGVVHRTAVETGRVADALRTAADAVRPTAVVTGSRGLSGWSKRALGSVTHDLVRKLDWPTVVIPAPRDAVVWTP